MATKKKEVVPTTKSGIIAAIAETAGITKREAVAKTVLGPITEDVPATVMRRHADCVMFCDRDSGADLL